MSDKILYEIEGVKDEASGGLAMVGIAVALTGLIVSLATSGMIGPWYIYAGLMAVCILGIAALGKKHGVKIQILDRAAEGVFMAISGKTHNVTFKMHSYTNWYHVIHRSVKRGGPEARIHFIATSPAGKHLHLQEVTLPNNAPKTWKQDNMQLPAVEATFLVSNLDGLAAALDAYRNKKG